MRLSEQANERLWDSLLNEVLIEDCKNELAELEVTTEPHIFSSDFEKKIQKIRHSVGRKELAIGISVFVRKAAITAAAITGVLFIGFLTQPKVYAAVCDVVRTVFEDHDSYSSNASNSNMDGKTFNNSIVPSYIPEGYKLRQAFYGDYNVDLIYENSDNMEMWYSYGTKDGTEISINNERIEYSEKIINGVTYYIYEVTIPNGSNSVIWSLDEYIFMIDSQISVDEIVKIAESVKE